MLLCHAHAYSSSDSKWLAARMLLFPTSTEKKKKMKKKKRKKGNRSNILFCEINIGVTASYLNSSTSEIWKIYFLDQVNKLPTKLWACLYCVVESSKMWL